MSDFPMRIRIGTMVRGDRNCAEFIRKIIHYGFESFQIFFWESLNGTDLYRLAEELRTLFNERNDAYPPRISTLALFGNPLADGERGETAREGWEALIEAAPAFETELVTGFTGRIPGSAWEESLPRFAEFFGPLSKRAGEKGIRLAFENCPMGGNWDSGDWNLAFNPAAWERLFQAVPADNLGLEWEPAHQILQLIDPLEQLALWAPKIFHVHGKDASRFDRGIRREGILGPQALGEERFPGFGESDWRRIVTELLRSGYRGTIDIEGHNDAFFRKELELTGQIRALEYLKSCRGGDYIPKP